MSEKSKDQQKKPAKAKGEAKAESAKAKEPKAAKAKAPEEKAPKKAEERPLNGYVPRLLTQYRTEVVPALVKRFSYKNTMQAPRLEKIVLNMGVGEAVEDQKHLEHAVEDMQTIAGQKPILKRAKKAISNFKLRQGVPIGCMVTLRQWRMYEFLDRFISLAVPRIRDFRGLPDNAFDGRGNYTVGIKEQIIFPEINYDKVAKIRGMNITFVTTAKTDEEAHELLSAFGMPFRKR